MMLVVGVLTLELSIREAAVSGMGLAADLLNYRVEMC